MKRTIKAGDLWNCVSPLDSALAVLHEDIPAMGKVDDKSRPMLEELRKFQNAYYRRYNSGDNTAHRLRHMAKRMGYNEFYPCDYHMEVLGHIVITKAWKEKLGA